jgi:putative hydrolase of the HAD superfamily
MNRTKAVFLDVGWTLLYPRESLWEIFAAVSTEAGAEISAAEIEGFVHSLTHRSRDRAIAQLESGARYSDSDEEFVALFHALGQLVYRRAGVPGDYDSFAAGFFERFWKAENWAIFPEVFDALEELRRRGVRLAALSNAGSDLVAFLDALGLYKWFDFAVVSAIEGVKKPDRRIFERALERASVEAHEAIHVGDMFLEDVLGARRAGLRPLLMDRGERAMFPNHPEVAEHPPGSLEVVRNLHDVVAALDSA